MEWVVLAGLLFLLCAAAEYLLTGLRGPWRLCALVPAAGAVLWGCALWEKSRGAGWGGFGAGLVLLLCLLPAAAGLLAGALARGIVILVRRRKRQ